jgi:2-oxoglutarate dehydrogenase E2 component (dihydrolipoamide succinyltransferase)
VAVGTVLGSIAEGKPGKATAVPAANPDAAKPAQAKSEAPKPQPAAPKPEAPKPAPKADAQVMPSAQRISAESGIPTAAVAGTGRDGRVTKGDMLEALEARAARPAQPVSAPSGPRSHADREEKVPMSRLRKTIALRLKESQNTAAQLTTFNEADMSRIMALRSEYKDSFEKKHGVRLGFMGFFAKACVAALKELPNVNAELEGDNIVYKNYYDIGVAVSTERGLVVPVVRDADLLSLADIEKAVMDFGARARDNKLKLEELQGGTFSITNGGVFGSLMSTPILNSPQSGILGMHKIQPRPMAIDGKVEIRPMMYLALSYDHRLVDGREAVTFLVRVKENLEDPERMLLDV